MYMYIYDRLLKNRVYYFDVDSSYEFSKQCKLYGFNIDGDHDGDAGFEYITNPEHRVLIWGPKKKIDLVAHECVHVAMYAMDRAGIPISYDNDEIVAYYVGFLMTSIYGEQLDKDTEEICLDSEEPQKRD